MGPGVGGFECMCVGWEEYFCNQRGSIYKSVEWKVPKEAAKICIK